MEAMHRNHVAYESRAFYPDIDDSGAADPRHLRRDIDHMEPGPLLATYLSTVDPDRLTGFDQVIALRAFQRMESHFAAKRLGAIASIVDVVERDDVDDGVPDHRGAEAELRAALHLTRRAAEVDIELALALRDRIPRVLAALERGDVDLRRARTFHTATDHLDEALARSVVDRVIGDASSLTTGQIRGRLERLAMKADSDAASKRSAAAHADRRVVIEPTADGTANLLVLDLLPHQATAAKNRLVHHARTTHRKGDDRTAAQIQADTAIELLVGASTTTVDPSAARGSVDLRVDLATLTELDNDPGDLAGYGPVVADIARKVTDAQRSSTWTYTVTDPEKGVVVHTGTTRRRPDAALRRAIEARFQTCVFPGCRMPAVECDIDHTTPWAAGGPTDESNLAPLCRHDHGIKTEKGWSYRVVSGEIVWTSPLGHLYPTVRPPP